MGKPGKPGSAAFGWLGPLSKHDLSFAAFWASQKNRPGHQARYF